MKQVTRLESIIKRQAIIDACKDMALTLTEIAKIVKITKSQLNHHLILLVKENYLEKSRHHILQYNQWAYNYKTINDQPYIATAIAPFTKKSKKIEVVNYPQPLLFKLGYTNIKPINGIVYSSLM